MSKTEALMRYQTALTVFQQWLISGAITKADLGRITAVIAAKYQLPENSIFAHTSCYVLQKE